MKITKKYNKRVNRTMDMKPIHVTTTAQHDSYKHPKSKLRVGDIVRINKYKTIFEKGYTSIFSTESFKIIKVNKSCNLHC